MISLKAKETKAVLEYLFLHEDAELYVNEMARKFSLDDGNLSRKLKQLAREGILKDPDILVLGNGMRMKRNQDLYGGGELISEKEAADYFVFVRKVFNRAEEKHQKS